MVIVRAIPVACTPRQDLCSVTSDFDVWEVYRDLQMSFLNAAILEEKDEGDSH